MVKTLELEPGEGKTVREVTRFVKLMSAGLSENGRAALVFSINRLFPDVVEKVKRERMMDEQAGS